MYSIFPSLESLHIPMPEEEPEFETSESVPPDSVFWKPSRTVSAPAPALKVVHNPNTFFPSIENLIQEFEEGHVEELPEPEPEIDPFEVERQQEEIFQQCRAQAEEEGYRAGFQEGEDRGQREGYAHGFEQGRREALAEETARTQLETDAFLCALEAKAIALNVAIDQWFADSEQAMTDLAMNVVKRLLSAELAISRESALAIAKEALSEVTHSKHARIRINPFDVPQFETHRAQLLAASCSLQDVDLVEDPEILGGCFIETEGGVVDATLARRLETLGETWQQAA